MKEMPTEDKLFGKGSVRADGRKIHDMYLFEVKKPEESRGPWDYYRLLQTTPAAEAFRPLGEETLVNMSVWADVKSLNDYVYRSDHLQIMRRRREWFERVGYVPQELPVTTIETAQLAGGPAKA